MSDQKPERKQSPEMTRRELLRAAGYMGAGAALGSLMGCSTKPNAPAAPAAAPASAPAVTGQAKAKLRVWLLKTYVEDANKAAEANIQEWAGKNNADVEVQYYTFDDMQTKYVAAIESKNLPDVGELDTIGPARYRAMGILTDVSGVVAEVEKASGKLSDSAKRSPLLDGKFWGVPHYNMPAVIYYRQDLLDKAGVKVPETYDEMRAAGKAIKDKTGVWGMGWPWNKTSDGYGPWVAVAASYGVTWADAAGQYKSINTPEARQMLEWMTAPYTTDKSAPPDALSWNGAGNNEAFMKGQVGITPNGPSITWAMERDKNPLLASTTSTKFPKGPKGAYGFLNMYSLGIFKTSKNPDLAASLTKHMMAPNVWNKYMVASGGQAIPIYEGFEGDAMWKHADRAQWLAQTKQDVNVGYPGPITAAAAEVQASNVLTDMVTKVIVDKWSFDQSIKWADERIKEIYATVKG